MVMQINSQLLTQIKALRKAQQLVIELSTKEAQVNTSSEVYQHLSVLTDRLTFQVKSDALSNNLTT